MRPGRCAHTLLIWSNRAQLGGGHRCPPSGELTDIVRRSRAGICRERAKRVGVARATALRDSRRAVNAVARPRRVVGVGASGATPLIIFEASKKCVSVIV